MNHIINHPFRYETEKLIRLFFPYEKIETTDKPNGDERYIETRADIDEDSARLFVSVHLGGESEAADEIKRSSGDEYRWTTDCERRLAQLLFHLLEKETGYTPPWGILTGIRPSKLMLSFCAEIGEENAKKRFENDYLVSHEKTELAYTVAKNEMEIISRSDEKSYSLYISIPFCPSRCSYCSFISSSNEQAKKLIPAYIEKLIDELHETHRIAEKLKFDLKSIYIGGGTPTALSAEQLKKVTDAVEDIFRPGGAVEYTIEAGRPDSITNEKLSIIKQAGARRISVNPQTFNDDVLKAIGRNHSAKCTADALRLAKGFGFDCINTDVIAGLPTENADSFENTIRTLLEYMPENITVHTLALKRSSTIVTEGLQIGQAKTAIKMLDLASDMLKNAGYKPYYMYRQSKCLGNLENVGWALEGKECEYNVHMMEETHTILAVGAGAVSKLKRPDRIDRIFNYKYPFEYIDDFDEMIRRKQYVLDFFG